MILQQTDQHRSDMTSILGNNEISINIGNLTWAIYDSPHLEIQVQYPKELQVTVQDVNEGSGWYISYSQPTINGPSDSLSEFAAISVRTKKENQTLENWFEETFDPTHTLIPAGAVHIRNMKSGRALYYNISKGNTPEFTEYLGKTGPENWFGFIEISPTQVLEISYQGQDNFLWQYLGGPDFNSKVDVLLIKIMEGIRKQ